MSPFTLFFARLVSDLGAEKAAQMVREFAGQTLQFPITDHYGFSREGSVLGAGFAQPAADHTARPSQTEPQYLSALANLPRADRLPAVALELGHLTQVLQLHAALLETARLGVLAEIESQRLDQVGP